MSSMSVGALLLGVTRQNCAWIKQWRNKGQFLWLWCVDQFMGSSINISTFGNARKLFTFCPFQLHGLNWKWHIQVARMSGYIGKHFTKNILMLPVWIMCSFIPLKMDEVQCLFRQFVSLHFLISWVHTMILMKSFLPIGLVVVAIYSVLSVQHKQHSLNDLQKEDIHWLLTKSINENYVKFLLNKLNAK